MRILHARSTAVSFCLLAVIIFGCNNLELNSRWRQSEIVVDGSHSDWEGALMYSEEKRVTVGFVNDDEHLYLCMMAADENVLMRSLTAGFTVWFDGMGNKKEKFGIIFPIGVKMFGQGMPGRDRDRHNRGGMRDLLEDQSELEIVRGDENLKRNLSELDDYGIELKIGQHLGRFIYELKMPLGDSDSLQYSVVPKDNRTIKVGFELGKMERPEMDRRSPRDGGGFSGGMRPGGGRGMHGRGKGEDQERPEELKLEIKVKLAHK